ncbi:MAG TPA: DUF192 domain-containing protein [Actinomycetota bacterium]
MLAEVTGPRGIRLRCRVAETRRDRARGLLGATALPADLALLLPNATSVHTFGMRFPILVARLDPRFRVIDVRILRPGHLLLPRRRARHVLEASPDLDLRAGDVLRVEGPGGLAILPPLPPGRGRGRARRARAPIV